jgi:hypothetical protein
MTQLVKHGGLPSNSFVSSGDHDLFQKFRTRSWSPDETKLLGGRPMFYQLCHNERVFGGHYKRVLVGITRVDDGADDNKPIWPTWAVGACLLGCETYSHQSRMFSHSFPVIEESGERVLVVITRGFRWWYREGFGGENERVLVVRTRGCGWF